MGVRFETRGEDIYVPAEQELRIQPSINDAIPKIDDGIWPAFPTDMMSIALLVATQCEGTVLFWEKMFEGRLFFVDRLIAMGARVVLCDPHRAVVVGPSPLKGEELQSPDIRAGVALLGAALCAEGRSVIGNIGQIDRGYERIDEKLRKLGAAIERVEE
jgi:UDP-N-acetylglucosamine 1-carboxyvinyltransferase